MWQHGHFHWNELMINDPENAKTFYGETLGWTFDAMPMGDDGGTYWICKEGDRPVGGIFDASKSEFEAMAPRWFSYLAVDDVDARLEKAVKAGGSIKQPPMDIPGVGRIAIVEDTTGAAIGWMTPTTAE